MASAEQHHQHNHHHDNYDNSEHAHHAQHDHVNSDYGPMYEQGWVKELLHHISLCIKQHISWMELDPGKSQGVLDYACGDGVVSRSLVTDLSRTTFQGLDVSAHQVDRFNDEVMKLPNKDRDRLSALQGDIMHASDTLNDQSWHEFDVAIVSMALHHMQHPVKFLKTLRQRVRKGGMVVVIDWLQMWRTADQKAGHDEAASMYDPENMITVPNGNLKIWPGFSDYAIRADLSAAGFVDVEVVEYPERIRVPEEMTGQEKFFIAKGIVP